MRDRAREGGGGGRGSRERGERERGNGGAVSETTPSRNLDEETFECTPEGGRRSCGERHNAIDRTTSSELLQFTVFPAFFSCYFNVVRWQARGDGEEGDDVLVT